VNKQLDTIKSEIENLAVKKKFKINLNGNKVKVVRDSETAYTIYHDGHFIQTVETLEDTFSFVRALLEIDCE
jgi:hypothetical protein